MANYVNINYTESLPAGPSLYVEYATTSWVTNGTQVVVSMIPPAWTPTHYKLWNFNGATTSGEASWQSWSPTVTGTILDATGEQYIYGQFKDESNITDVLTTSGITFEWTEPVINGTLTWEQDLNTLGYDSTTSATLRNVNQQISIDLNKDNIPGLSFHEADLSSLIVSSNTISCSPDSELGELLSVSGTSFVTITKVFDTDDVPMVKVDTGSGFVTLTTYSGTVRTDVTGDYSGRVDNINYDSGTNTLTFDVHKFSTYGFTSLHKIEFTSDSQNGGYVGNSINLKVRVTDTNGEGVEDAPVTFSGTGDAIGNFTVNPVLTDVDGYAIAELNLTSAGSIEYDAYVDSLHTAVDQHVYCSEYPTDIGRSLLDQVEQIRRTGIYTDTILNANTQAVAEPSDPTVSGNSDDVLEHDTNVLRTMLRQIKGTTNWYDELGTYFNPSNTTSGGDSLETFNLEALRDNTLASKTILLAVEENNSGAGFTVSGTDTGILYDTGLSYADWSDRRGLPIFNSVTNSGSYADENGNDDICAIDLIDTETGTEFKDASDNIIYAKFHDGADFGGSGEGVTGDVYVRFYSNGSPYTWQASDPSNIMFIFPYRKIMNEMEEYEWTRTDFVNSFEGDAELIEDMANLWAYTGSSNNDPNPEPWTHEEDYYSLSTTSESLTEAINALNSAVGDRQYTDDNYITDGDTIASSLDNLDVALKTVETNLSVGIGVKLVESVSGTITAGTTHTIPDGYTYTPYSTNDYEAGKNMQVYMNGQLLAASTGVAGINMDRDYAEVTASGIQFHFDVYDETNIIYIIKN